MTADDSLLAQGIAAAKAGAKSTARQLLTRAVHRDPDSEVAWFWLSAVLDTPQGRAFCLRKALSLNPDSLPAQRGLAALAASSPAPAVVAQQPPVAPARLARIRRRFSLEGLIHQTRFWQVLVACLAVIALGLVGTLVYAALSGSRGSEEYTLAALLPSPSYLPQGTLRPTFTPRPTDTPVPTQTATHTSTPTSSPTPTLTPTDTPTATTSPTDTPTRRVRKSSPSATPQPTPVPRPTLQPRSLDPRLSQLGIQVEPAAVGAGQAYWRLVDVRWANEQESAGKHSVYVEVLDVHGNRVVGQPVIVRWSSGSVVLPVENRPPPDWGVNFAMYNTLGSYAVSVGGGPSDRLVGLGLGTAEAPDFTIHTCFYLVYRLTYR